MPTHNSNQNFKCVFLPMVIHYSAFLQKYVAIFQYRCDIVRWIYHRGHTCLLSHLDKSFLTRLCYYYMHHQQEQEEITLQHYLRALRKKVEHHLKNPFEIPFASYSFQELSNWKNSILQLDATSILYGQRVDHLHSGTMVVLDSMLKNAGENKMQQIANLDAKVKKSMINENSPLEKHLEDPRKMNAQELFQQKNLVLWREIMKKRDTLPLLMLNQLTLSNDLRMQLCQSNQQKYYETLVSDEGSNYLKQIDFGSTSTKKFNVLTFVTDFLQNMNYELLSLKPQEEKVRDATMYEEIINFDFSLTNYHSQNYNPEAIEFKEADVGEINQQNFIGDNQRTALSSDDEDTLTVTSFFSDFTLKTDESKQKKPKKKQKGKKKTLKRQDVFVDFRGFHLTKFEVFQKEKEEPIQDLYLNPKDHLLLKFNKYNYPFRKSRRMNLVQPLHHNIADQETHLPNFQSQFRLESAPFVANPQTSITATASFQRQTSKIKQAVLPIKEMKKRIRNVMHGHTSCKIPDLKMQLPLEDPLDIFITTLHIAAQDGMLLAL